MKVVVTMDIDASLQTRLRQGVDPQIEFVFAHRASQEKTVALCGEADIVIGSAHLEAILSSCPSVRLVQVPWAGVDHLCEVVRRHEGVRLANSHANAYVTAQFAVALCLALLNRLVAGHDIIQNGRWDKRWAPPPPVNPSDKTAGILGAGQLGHEVARLIGPFVPRVIGLKRTPATDQPAHFDKIVGTEELDWFLGETDLLFITLPLTKQTRDMIGRRELRLLGKTGYLINIGRGEIVREYDLFEALKRKEIAGAALEVWYDYDPPSDDKGRRFPFREPFHQLDNLLMSPHRAGWTEPSPDYWADIMTNVNRLVAGDQEILNEVDVQAGY